MPGTARVLLLALLITSQMLLPVAKNHVVAQQLGGPPDAQSNWGVCTVDWGPLFQDQTLFW